MSRRVRGRDRRWLQHVAAALVLLSSPGSVMAQAFALEPPERYTLPNGLEVILSRDDRQPSVAVWLRYAVGSRDDPEGYAGLAHMVEHMTFRGSRHLEELEMLALLERAGAEGANASTHPDWTAYYSVVPAHQLPLVLWLESERMAFTLEAMNEAKFQVEREIVLNERGQRSGLGSRVPDFLSRALFPARHVYHRSGDPDTDEASFTLENARWFFQRWYRPDLATLTLVGRFEPERVKREIERYFAPIPAGGERPARASAAAAPLAGAAELHVSLPVDRERVEVTWLAPVAYADWDAELLLLYQVLAGSPEAELQRALERQTRLASAVDVSLDQYELHTQITVSADVTLGVEPERVRDGIDAVVRGLQEKAFAAQDLQQAKVALKTSIISGFEPLLQRAAALATYRSARARDALYDPNATLERVSELSPDALRDAARRFLPLDRRVVVYRKKRDRAPSEGRLERQVGSALPAAAGEQ